MSALRETRRRIRSVEGTRQVTRALQLVAASKLKRAEILARAARTYADETSELLARVQGQEPGWSHPLYEARTPRRGLTVVVSADRGMTGSHGPELVRALTRHARALGLPQRVICLGTRGAHFAARTTLEVAAYYEIERAEASELAQAVLLQAEGEFLAGEVDLVHLVYTRFHSAARHEPAVEQLMPAVTSESTPAPMLVEGSFTGLLQDATEHELLARLTAAILDARAGEQAARMVAMLQATNNATDLIDDLTFAYHQERQTAITTELAEITAGEEVQRG